MTVDVKRVRKAAERDLPGPPLYREARAKEILALCDELDRTRGGLLMSLKDLQETKDELDRTREQLREALQKCPVCEGRGSVLHDFYLQAGVATGTNRELCRACVGSGLLRASAPSEATP